MTTRRYLQYGAIVVVAAALSFGGAWAYRQAHQPKPVVVHEIKLLASGASPGELAIKVGETVQFNSKDGAKHLLTQGEAPAADGSVAHTAHGGGGLTSGVFKADEGYRVTFTKNGTYTFYDEFNPKTNILIVVYQPSAKAK
mgnify:CR=1 FL=1